jgi:membrane-bound lytic murein transglycosylase A
VARGALRREEVTLPAIRAWLRAHPAEAPAVLDRNASYVFFRILSGGVVGSQGVELEAGRSLAIDPRFLPLGAPLWLAATAPAVDPAQPDAALRRLVVAQDTGGAIRGPLRGDVFFGAGPDAEAVAGRMKHRGRLWLLLPKTAVATALAARSPTAAPPATSPPAAPKPTTGAL